MQIETTHETDVQCKDLIGEAYEVAYEQYPEFGGFSGLSRLWEKVQEVFKFDLSTNLDEDVRAEIILKEVFEEACRSAEEDGHVDYGSTYVDYKRLWERICGVLGVQV